jgi:hypothetical protein
MLLRKVSNILRSNCWLLKYDTNQFGGITDIPVAPAESTGAHISGHRLFDIAVRTTNIVFV